MNLKQVRQIPLKRKLRGLLAVIWTLPYHTFEHW